MYTLIIKYVYYILEFNFQVVTTFDYNFNEFFLQYSTVSNTQPKIKNIFYLFFFYILIVDSMDFSKNVLLNQYVQFKIFKHFKSNNWLKCSIINRFLKYHLYMFVLYLNVHYFTHIFYTIHLFLYLHLQFYKDCIDQLYSILYTCKVGI